MDTFVLPDTTISPEDLVSEYAAAWSPLERRLTLNTIIEDEPQVTNHYFPSSLSSKAMMLSSASFNDHPNPKGIEEQARIIQHSYNLSPTKIVIPLPHQGSIDLDDYDDLYDVSDAEAEYVPLKCSDSVKRLANKSCPQRNSRGRYPSIEIPSPSAWPTIQKLQKAAASQMPLTPSAPICSPSARVLSMLAAHNLQIPATSATPSLDGSLSSEEMAELSCPSTPDHDQQKNIEEELAAPVQLPAKALETLHHLSLEEQENSSSQPPEQAPTEEMQEIIRPHNFFKLSIPSPCDDDASDVLSTLSIPSPGGFFSSLGSTARSTWCEQSDEEEEPSTSTAEEFYGVPWKEQNRKPPTLMLAVLEQKGFIRPAEWLESAQTSPTMVDAPEVLEIEPAKTIYEYNENYAQELKEEAATNISRTCLWLSEQGSYLDELLSSPITDESSKKESSTLHARQKSSESSSSSPSKKTVRFIDDEPEHSTEEKAPEKTTTFVEAFEYILEKSCKSDAFIHSQTRAEFIHLNRRCTNEAHRNQLLGNYELTEPVRPSPPRPVSSFYTDDPTVLKERIARAQMERQALEQVRPAAWVLEALKVLNGGKLLSKTVSKVVSRTRNARVLDLGGQAFCDWAWRAALDYPHAMIHTVSTVSVTESNLARPDNHRYTAVPNLWTLPFPNCYFDVISARTLYTWLKINNPIGRTSDEYDLCIKECFRCLKPGGYLEFSLLDSDILRAGPLAQALSVEFGFNLRTRGYDACPTKSFLPRLRRRGFQDIQRAWMVLPMGQTAAKWGEIAPNRIEKSIDQDGEVQTVCYGSTADAAGLSGLVGSWAWEKWMLKLQVEMGKEDDRLLEGVIPVLEEGSKCNAGWRYLTGYARKPE